MRYCFSKTLLLTIPLLCSVVLHDPAHAESISVHRDSFGYTITVPDGWKEIPRAVLDEFTEQSVAPESKIRYDFGFQLDTNGRWFEYPYVLVRAQLYTDYDLNRQPYESELADIVEQLTGLPAGELVARELSADMARLIEGVSIDDVVLDSKEHNAAWSIRLFIAGIGEVRGAAFMHFGADSFVQVLCYARDENWDTDWQILSPIAESFRFDSISDYDSDRAEAPFFGNPFGPGPGGVSFWAVILLTALVVRSKRRARRR